MQRPYTHRAKGDSSAASSRRSSVDSDSDSQRAARRLARIEKSIRSDSKPNDSPKATTEPTAKPETPKVVTPKAEKSKRVETPPRKKKLQMASRTDQILNFLVSTILNFVLMGIVTGFWYAIYLAMAHQLGATAKIDAANALTANNVKTGNIMCDWTTGTGASRPSLTYRNTFTTDFATYKVITNTSACANLHEVKKQACTKEDHAWELALDAKYKETKLFNSLMWFQYGSMPPSGFCVGFVMFIFVVYVVMTVKMMWAGVPCEYTTMRVVVGSSLWTFRDVRDVSILFVLVMIVFGAWAFFGPTLIPVLDSLWFFVEYLWINVCGHLNYWLGRGTTTRVTKTAQDANFLLQRMRDTQKRVTEKQEEINNKTTSDISVQLRNKWEVEGRNVFVPAQYIVNNERCVIETVTVRGWREPDAEEDIGGFGSDENEDTETPREDTIEENESWFNGYMPDVGNWVNMADTVAWMSGSESLSKGLAIVKALNAWSEEGLQI